jgi:hypothetical protein
MRIKENCEALGIRTVAPFWCIKKKKRRRGKRGGDF